MKTQILKIKITIESEEEATVVKQEVKINCPATQNEVDAEIEKVYEQYGEEVIVGWNEERLNMVD